MMLPAILNANANELRRPLPIYVACMVCTMYATMRSLVETSMKVSPAAAGHKGFVRAGASTAIYTGLTDIETECDGFLTYDRRALKYDEGRLKGAVAMLKAAATPMPPL